MNLLIIGIWFVNLILSIIYGIYSLGKGKNQWIILLFISLPVFGFCMYFFPKIVLHNNEKVQYDRESLVRRYDLERSEKMPILKKELDIISIEDAMAISSNNEKRTLLLDQLKKGMDSNYRVVLPAGGDRDSESAHYVATAKMEVYRKKREELKELQEILDKKSEDVELIDNYLNGLCDYINSELLMPKEALIYKIEYRLWFERLLEADPSKITALKNTEYIKYLIDLGENKKAEKYWEECSKDLKNECGYRKMLNMYYDMADKDNFYKCISKLEDSDIKLSAEGLKIIRYWIIRRK